MQKSGQRITEHSHHLMKLQSSSLLDDGICLERYMKSGVIGAAVHGRIIES
jgi:hypothetical protein